MIPDYWKKFVSEHLLEEADFEISEEIDLSGAGAELSIMSEKHVLEEMDEAYPGIVVKKDGFVPVGSCLIGCGDPYFININDGAGGALYRIYHDCVFDEGYEKSQAVDLVLNSYSELIKYKR